MEKALRAAGCRLTRQRTAILAFLSSTDSHPSARQVYREAEKNCPGLSLATVYNTLETLSKVGILKVLDFDTMDNRHETNLNPHINLICSLCGKIQDFDQGLPLYAERARDDLGFEVRDYRMEYYGTCAECRERIEKDY